MGGVQHAKSDSLWSQYDDATCSTRCMMTVFGVVFVWLLVGFIAGLKPADSEGLAASIWTAVAALLATLGLMLSGLLPRGQTRGRLAWLGIFVGLAGVGMSVTDVF